MGHKYSELAFSESVKAVQRKMGSRAAYARRESGPDFNDRIGPTEAAFIAARDSFYIASVSETGWPYVQFRGGPPGFLRVLDEGMLGYADFRGNKQYITMGNVMVNNRVSLFLMDYVHRERLKILGRMAVTDAKDDPELTAKLIVQGYDARVERAVVIMVAALDWNCPQHIVPRFTQYELVEALAPSAKRWLPWQPKTSACGVCFKPRIGARLGHDCGRACGRIRPPCCSVKGEP